MYQMLTFSKRLGFGIVLRAKSCTVGVVVKILRGRCFELTARKRAAFAILLLNIYIYI
jgi:hypothetical protein